MDPGPRASPQWDLSSLHVPKRSYLRVSQLSEDNETGTNSGAGGPDLEQQPFDIQKCVELSGSLGPSEVISLVFLLLNDAKEGFKLCKFIEENGTKAKPGFSWGKWFMQMLVAEGRKKSSYLWMSSIVCSLHLLRQYKFLFELNGMARHRVIKRYEDKEYLFLNHMRVMLFKFSMNMTSAEAMAFTSSLKQDLQEDSSAPHQTQSTEGYKQLETHLLELLEDDHRFNPKRDFKRFQKYLSGEIENNYERFIKPLVPFVPQHADKILTKGWLLILNQREFSGGNNYDNRTGTEVDESELIATANRFGCQEHEVLRDLKAKEIVPRIRKAKDRDFSSLDYVVVCLMSHGERVHHVDYILGVDGERKMLKEILDEFITDPKLTGKLKLFLIQACRGKEAQPLISSDSRQSLPALISLNSSPMYKDFITFHSTVPEYVSYRNSLEGSYFIQLLCKELEVHGAHMDLHSVLRRVADNIVVTSGIQVPQIDCTYFANAFLRPDVSSKV